MKTLKFFFSLAALCLFLPSMTHAAAIYFDTDATQVSAGDTIVVNVRLNTQGVAINAVDGAISLRGDKTAAVIKEFSLADSVLSVWLAHPSLSANKESITFTGGMPGGFTAADAILFKIIVSPQQAGQLVLNVGKSSAYINDGKGTLASTSGQSLTIAVNVPNQNGQPRNDWQSLLTEDHTPPEPFTVAINQDPNLYNGQKFITFYATDKQSGVDYYEVLEGNLPPVRSGSPYVLQNQTTPEKISVVAHDKAGNLQLAVYTPPELAANPSAISSFFHTLVFANVLTQGAGMSWQLQLATVAGLLIVFGLIWLALKIRQKNKK